jgi:endonuclease YncB( thermonuclease family)
MRKNGRTIAFGFCSLILTGQIWADLISCAVRNIHDGDKLKARYPGPGIVKVRFHCIDALEIKQQPWGADSPDYLRALAGYGSVRIIQNDRDRYGRIVGEVVLGRQVLNLAMVQAGQAAVYPTYCKDNMQPGSPSRSYHFRQ